MNKEIFALRQLVEAIDLISEVEDEEGKTFACFLRYTPTTSECVQSTQHICRVCQAISLGDPDWVETARRAVSEAEVQFFSERRS